MKCEKCKENEASFFYTAVVNGKTTAFCLCSDCAQEEGFLESMDRPVRRGFGPMMPSPWMMPRFFFGPTMFPGFMHSAFFPVLAMPGFELGLGEEPQEETEPAQNTEAKIPAEADPALKAKRELLLLKNQLQEAVRNEEFEKAIELRDKIRELEK